MTAAALRLEAPADPVLLVALRLRDFLQAGETIDARLLRDLLASTTGRSAADGGWSMRHAYDALEVAQVLWLGSAGAGMDLSSPSAALDALIDLGRRLPTQTVRTEDQLAFQQFSTPAPIAWAMSVAAQLRSSDTVLEPSAGTGLLVWPAAKLGAALVLNEIDPGRRHCLELAFPHARISDHDGELVDDLLPVDVQADLLLINPPFARSIGRPVDRHAAARHLHASLRRLKIGGRAVAIMPTWFDRQMLGSEASIRLDAVLPRGLYVKHGTGIAVRLLVLDKLSVADEGPAELEMLDLPALLDAIQHLPARAGPSDPLPPTPRARLSMFRRQSQTPVAPRPQPGAGEPDGEQPIEVVIVRPGPIQGDMVHPYLRRREGIEKPNYPRPELRAVLEKTLGVPLFQEQAMKVAIVGAGFTASEADQLRRAMATFKFTGGVSHFYDKLVEGMVERGYPRDFAERTFKQIEGFGSYGFPESHAASFAKIAYASCWMKHHHPDVFCAALLNAQPMGFYSMETLATAPDLWSAIGPGSQARAQRFLTRDGSGAVTSTIQTCREAYTTLSGQWNGMVDDLGRVFGRQLYPKQTADLARAKLFADLPVAYQYLTGVSASASAILRQSLTINAMQQAMHSAAGTSGTGSVDVYAQTRADIQTERTYGSIAHAAMKWVPVLNIVLTVLFYALFPVLFPLFLMPRSGPYALKGYVTGFFYLAAWGPLYVILHMVMMLKGAAEVTGAGSGNGLTLASFTGMTDANDDVGLLAGYLVASIPFLAGGIARGAMAISSQATSYLNPSQNAAEEAAREASTGNIALGNSSFDNQTIQTRQHDQWNQAPSFTYGAAQTRSFNETGTLATSFAGNQVLDVPVSKLPFMPQVTQSVAAEAAKVASETRSRGETLSNQAIQSTSNAVTRFQEFRHAMSTDRSVSDSYGNEDRANISSTFNEVDQASRMLQSRFGLRAEVADSIAVESFVSGSASVEGGLGATFGAVRIGANANLTGGKSKSWNDSDQASVSRDGARINDALHQWSQTHGWSQNRDSFQRSMTTSGRSDVNSSASGISSNVSEAVTKTSEARRFFEEARRLEERWSVSNGNGVHGSLNTTDSFLQFARAEIAATPLVYKSFDPANATHWASSDPQISSERRLLVTRYIASASDEMRRQVEESMTSPDAVGLSSPRRSLASDMEVSARGASVRSAVRQTPSTTNLLPEVRAVQQRGEQAISRRRGALELRTQGAGAMSQEAAEAARTR